MRVSFSLTALALLAACVSTPEEPTAQRVAAAPQSPNQIIETQAAPGIRACVQFAGGGSFDANALVQSGFTGPRSSLGRTIYDAPNLFVVLNTNRNECRITWLNSPAAPAATAVLKETLASAGFSATGQSNGQDIIYTNGTANLSASSTLTTSQYGGGLDIILKRR